MHVQQAMELIANKANHAISAEAKVRQNYADDDHETDDIDDGIHTVPLNAGVLFCAPDVSTPDPPRKKIVSRPASHACR